MKVTLYRVISTKPDAKKCDLFKSVNFSTCSVLYFPHHHEIITFFLLYLALMRHVLLLLLNVADIPPIHVNDSSITSLMNVRYCRYSVMSCWWWVKYSTKHVEQLTDLNKQLSLEIFEYVLPYYTTQGPLNIKIHFIYHNTECVKRDVTHNRKQ